MDAATSIQKKFYQEYPPHASEPEYLFEVPSTMKPTITQVRVQSIRHIRDCFQDTTCASNLQLGCKLTITL